MKRGGFQLRKWAANSPALLKNIPASQHELVDHLLAKDETLKILGLSWLPQEDVFCFVIATSLTASPLGVRSCRSSPSSTIHWDGLPLWSSLQRFCFKSSGCSRTIGMRQSHKNWCSDGRTMWTTSRIWRGLGCRAGPASAKRIPRWN